MSGHWSRKLGSLELHVEHRKGGAGDGGPTLRVVEADDDSREWLRFDCFDSAPHFHLDPSGRDEITAMDALADNVTWVVGELRQDFESWLAKSGRTTSSDWSTDQLDRALGATEDALRNPPGRFDDLDASLLHTRFGEKWNTYPEDVLPAWVAEMDFPLAEPIRRVLQRAVDRWDIGYPVALEETGLAEAFAHHMAERFDWEISPRRVEVLSEVVQGMYIAIEAFSEKGDGVIVQTPIYPPFLQAVSETGRRLVDNRLALGDSGFEIDFDALETEVDASTRVFLLCNPHNPSGRVFTRAELERLGELCQARDIVVVANEIHADLVYDGHEHIPFATLSPELAERTITLTSATKAFNIPGLRCALAHFGSPQLARRFNRGMSRKVRGGIGILGIYATIAAWRHSGPWLDEVLATLAANRAFLKQTFPQRFPGVAFHEPQGTYLAWLDFRSLDLPKTPGAFLLERGRVALTDGHLFGQGLEGFARINFATSRNILEAVLDRVETALKG